MQSFWQLQGFEDALDRWIATEDPSIELRVLVTEWVVGRSDEPYTSVRRRAEVAANYWFGTIPGSQEEGRVVVSGYWIDEELRSVRCDSITTLSLPV